METQNQTRLYDALISYKIFSLAKHENCWLTKASAEICYMGQHFCIYCYFGNDYRIRIPEIATAFYRCSEAIVQECSVKNCSCSSEK